jgi:hypothetical protein
MDYIVELTVIEIKALSRLHDFGVRFDIFDADNRLIFDNRIQGGKPGAGSAVAKKLVMTNEEKVSLLLGKEFLHDDVVPFKDQGRQPGEAVIDSVVEWRFEPGTISIILNKATRRQSSPKRCIPPHDRFRTASVV